MNARRSARVRHPRLRLLARALVVLTIITLALVGTTRAFLSDDPSLSTVTVQGVTVDPPTGLTATEDGVGDIIVGWTSPSTNETPTSYEIFRRASGAAWPSTPIATVTHPTSTWTDASVVDCNSYLYRVRSVHGGIVSDPTTQVAVTPGDTQRPTIVRSRIAGTSGIPDIADFVKPDGEFYAFVQVTDTCSDAEGIGVELDLTNLGPTGSQSASFGAWTAGGTSYNFRAGPFTTSAALTNGQQPAWPIAASDDGGARNGTGLAPVVDAIGPVAASAPQVVSADTNYYAISYGRGEVRPGSSVYAYARYTDAGSGMPTQDAAVELNAANLAGPSVVALADGSFSTDNGVTTWTRRSAATGIGSPTPGPKTVTFTAQDAVGNVTVTSTGVDVDETGLVATACTATDGGGPANRLRQADLTGLTFDDTVDPGSIAASWTGAANTTFTATLTNGASTDFFVFSGITLLAGSSQGTAFDLGSAGWVGAAGVAFTGSQLTLPARDALTIEYRGGTSTPLNGASGTMHLSPSVTDAAGNALSTTSIPCSTSW